VKFAPAARPGETVRVPGAAAPRFAGPLRRGRTRGARRPPEGAADPPPPSAERAPKRGEETLEGTRRGFDVEACGRGGDHALQGAPAECQVRRLRRRTWIAWPTSSKSLSGRLGLIARFRA